MTRRYHIKNNLNLRLLFGATLSFLLAACGGGSSSISTGTSEDGSLATIGDGDNHAVDTSRFMDDAVVSIETVSCTLSDGSASSCYEITLNGFPADRTSLGPFCPETTSTGANDAGTWFDDGVLYDLTGAFVADLANFYNDDNWQLYNEQTGDVYITNTQAACEAAAQPNVPANYNNYCVQCDISYYSDEALTGISATYLIPTTPQPRDVPGAVNQGGVGAAFNGVKLDAAAPTEAILGAYTIAAFDECVGHVNPHAGYHYHGANHGDGDCPGIDFETDGHGGAFGYALDGYAIYAMVDSAGNESTDLDSCRGHSDETRGYHYHTASAGENAFIGCFAGETAR